MVGKIWRGCHHPVWALAHDHPAAEVKESSSHWREDQVIWFPRVAITFFVGCFSGWETGLRIKASIAFSFLVLDLHLCMIGKGDNSLLKAIIALCAIQTKEVCLNVIQLHYPLDVVQQRRDVVFVADSSKSWRGLPRGWTQLSTRTCMLTIK